MVEINSSSDGRDNAPRDPRRDRSETEAEEVFRAGLALLRRNQPQDALTAFKHALNLAPDDARYLSFYGLCLATTGRNPTKGVQLCETAAGKGFYRSELHLNLGKAYLLAGKPEKAHEAFRAGLALDVQDREIIRELERMGIRRRPIFPFLDRRHPLNRWPGMVRNRLRRTRRG